MVRRIFIISILYWLIPFVAWAAPVHVQSPTPVTASSGSSVAIAFGSNVTAGNHLVCHIYANHVISTVADSLSQTFTSAVNVTDGATYSLATFYKENTLGGADTVTVTFAGSITYASVQCSERSGLAASGSLDKFASNSQTTPGTGANAVTSGSVTTTTDGQLIVGWSTALTVGAGTTSAGTGFTARTNVFGDTLIEDQVQTSAGAIAATFTTNSATSNFITLITTFKVPAAAASSFGARLRGAH